MRLSRFVVPMLSPFAVALPSLAYAQGGSTPPATGTAPETAPATTPAQPTPLPTPEPAPSGGAAAPKSGGVEITTLRLMLAKGIISQAEYDSAVKDLSESSGQRAPEGTSLVVGKWATTFYGFVEGDTIYDTTQSFNEIAGNGAVAKQLGGNYNGNHDRYQFTIRNSRIGFRLKAPETNGIRASAQLEMDFFGPPNPASGAEATVFNNSLFRVRHMNFKVETPIVDLLVGQYWTLLGWHAGYLPASVEIQGVPGGIFSRQVQVQISKTIKAEAVTFDIAVAALRPPQRDSGAPAGQGGLRFAVNKWTAAQTANYTGTSIQPLSVAVTGDVRSIKVPEYLAAPQATNGKLGTVLAVDAFVPIVKATKEDKSNSLALVGEYTTGYGGGDMYTGLTGGITAAGALPAFATPAGGKAPAAYDPRIDNGIGAWTAPNSSTFEFKLIQWSAMVGGIQYYFPGGGNVFVSANYSHIESSNSNDFANSGTANNLPASTRKALDWADFNLFWDMTSAVRFGAEYANFRDLYNNGQSAINHRVQVSGAFLF